MVATHVTPNSRIAIVTCTVEFSWAKLCSFKTIVFVFLCFSVSQLAVTSEYESEADVTDIEGFTTVPD